MTPILDRFMSRPAAFRPKSVSDLFALQLARRLNDAAGVGDYAQLASQHSRARLLVALRRAIKSGDRLHLSERFHLQLEKIGTNGFANESADLLAVRVERRSLAAAIYHGEHMEYSQVRQLTSDKDKVVASALRFITWIANQFPLDSAAVETIPNGNQIQRKTLTEAIIRLLRDRLLPIWEIDKKDLFFAFGNPPLVSRKELREVVTGIWPILAGAKIKTFVQDAAALGLYVQVERLFLN